MPTIKPSSELRNNYNEISDICHKSMEPIFITRNGKGDLAVMSIEFYEKITNHLGINKFFDDKEKSKNTKGV